VDGRTVQVQINVRVATVREKSGDLENQRRVILAVPLTEVRSAGRDYAMIESEFFWEALGADVDYSGPARTLRITTAGASNAAVAQVAIGTLLQLDPVEPVTLRVQVEGKEQTFTAPANVPVVRVTQGASTPDAAALAAMKATDFAEKLALNLLATGQKVAVKYSPATGVEWIAALGATPVIAAAPTPTPTPEAPAFNPAGAPQKLLTVTAQSGPVAALASTPDGKILATAGDKIIKIWKFDAEKSTLEATQTLAAKAIVRALAWSPDGMVLATGGDDRQVQLWDGASGKPLHTFTGAIGPVTALAFSPDGLLLASGAREEGSLPRGEVRIWHVPSKQLKQQLPQLQSGCSGLTYSRTGLLATLSGRFYVDVWKIDGGSYDYDRSFLERWDRMQTLAFSPDGQWLAAGNEDGTVRAWSMSNPPTREPKWTQRADGAVTAISFTADGRSVCTGTSKGTLKLWSIRDGRTLTSWQSEDKAGVTGITVAGSTFVTSSSAGNLTAWRLK
jgi:hypothetical protein